jgi:hypothetical protein
MKRKIEKAVLINGTNADINGADRIYFGNEFCENLIPTLASLKKFYFFTKSQYKEFTFITPFVTNAGLRKLRSLLNFLNSQHNIEVVFNDWGVFKLMRDRFKNLKPVLGRLLTKQRRDPRMLKIFCGERKLLVKFGSNQKRKTMLFLKKIPRTLFEHYQASLINLPVFQEYLLSLGINRLEIDNLVWKMNIKVNKKLGVSIYLPYGYIATSRMCGKLTLTYAACKKECKKYFFQLEDASLPVPFYGIGNAIFYKSTPPSNQYLGKLGIDRIIYQPRLPY